MQKQGVLLQDELVPQEGRAGGEHHLVPGDLQLGDAHRDVTEAPLVAEEVHPVERRVPERREAELEDDLGRVHGGDALPLEGRVGTH